MPLASCDNFKTTNDRVIKIGESIINIDTIKTGNPIIPDVVFIGDNLIDKVLLIKRNSKTYSLKVENGDFKKPFGNNKADCILTIDTDFQDIGIRLKYNKQRDKYDILGWKTL